MKEDKLVIDKGMQRLVHIGILKQDMSPCSSFIMLIVRKNLSSKRFISNYRF